jgi:hypothetical protein
VLAVLAILVASSTLVVVSDAQAITEGSYNYSGSTTFAITTGTAQSVVTLTTAAVKVGSTETITGVLKSSTGVAITGASVSVQITKPDGTKTTASTVTTNSNGGFTYTMTPSVAGTYTVTAKYSGSTKYAASSATKTFAASTVVSSTAYDLKVSGTTVKNAAGTTVYTGSSFTATFGWAIKQANKRVYVPAGTWNINSAVKFASGVTLFGDGSGTSGTILNFAATGSFIRMLAYNVDDINMHDFRVTGNGRIEIRADSGSTHHGYTLTNIVAYRTTSSGFVTWTATKATLQDISFYRCQAIETKGCGFYIGGDYSNQDAASTHTNAGWTKNIYFEDCKALWCGKNGPTTPYVCGFDLSEGTNIRNMDLVRCQSDYNWMDGFHFERSPYTLDCVFTDCSASYNGQKGSGYGFIYRTETGWHETTLTNCHGIGNKGGDAYNVSTKRVTDLPSP